MFLLWRKQIMLTFYISKCTFLEKLFCGDISISFSGRRLFSSSISFSVHSFYIYCPFIAKWGNCLYFDGTEAHKMKIKQFIDVLVRDIKQFSNYLKFLKFNVLDKLNCNIQIYYASIYCQPIAVMKYDTFSWLW